MGFWKSWFSGSEAAAATKTTPVEEHTTESVDGSSQSGTSITFSSDRDLDLYELEELCDAVGWARRPLRKVKKRFSIVFSSFQCGRCEVLNDG